MPIAPDKKPDCIVVPGPIQASQAAVFMYQAERPKPNLNNLVAMIARASCLRPFQNGFGPNWAQQENPGLKPEIITNNEI